MALQGDPAAKTPHLNPELILDEIRTWFTPEQIDLSVDSFDLNVVITNVGKAFNDSVRLEIQQFFPDMTDTLYSKDIKGVKFRDISFSIAFKTRKSIGINDFRISVDLPISTNEHDDFNNNEIYKSTITNQFINTYLAI